MADTCKPRRGTHKVTDLWAKSSRSEGSTCWQWLGATSDGGKTPRIWTFDHDKGERVVMPGPRAVWNIANQCGLGSRLAFMACVNSLCVNPAHVRVAVDRAEIGAHIAASGKRKGKNLEQRRANLRKAWAASGKTITPPALVIAIRAATGTGRAIGLQFGVNERIVSRIRRGEAHLNVMEAAA